MIFRANETCLSTLPLPLPYNCFPTDRSKVVPLLSLCCVRRRFLMFSLFCIILTPLKPHFYIVNLRFTGVCIFFLFLLKNIDCGYSLEPPHRGGSNEYPQSMFWAEMWRILELLSENFNFLLVKFSIYLNRRVFVLVVICSSSLLVLVPLEGCASCLWISWGICTSIFLFLSLVCCYEITFWGRRLLD